MTNNCRKTWQQLKQIVEFNRKILYSLNADVPANITFREYLNHETNHFENRVYFLANGQNRDNTLKFIDLKSNTTLNNNTNNVLTGQQLITNTYIFPDQKANSTQLTKEEQLLRERQRCSFNGITSYFLDQESGRILFSEKSELFYFDEKISESVNLFLFI
jgi:hypothetical protein